MLGETIRLLRLERGLTPEQLADMAGVSPQSIGYYEENTWCPGTEAKMKIAGAFGVTVSELEAGYSILVDEAGDMLLVRHMGTNLIRVIGQVQTDTLDYYRKEIKKLCCDK